MTLTQPMAAPPSGWSTSVIARRSTLPPANYMLLLNRNENIIPAVAKLKSEQAAAYFMLGETKGTSAGGAVEEGKNLRVPGTNPFFFNNDAMQGNRLFELLATMPDLDVYLMNTGRVGGTDADERSKKVKIKHSSAVVRGIVSGRSNGKRTLTSATSSQSDLPGFDDYELLRPYRLYERQGRLDEYARIVARLKEERNEYLNSFPGLDPSIVTAI